MVSGYVNSVGRMTVLVDRTEDGGLNHFNPKTKEFHFEPSAGFTNIHGLCMDGSHLWVGTFSKDFG